jgi:hypothetical protein
VSLDANAFAKANGPDALRDAIDRGAEVPLGRIRLVPFDKIVLGQARRYLVKGLVPRVGLVVVWGPPKSGKSFWTFDLVMHVALGREYRGRKVQQGPVVYCAFEGATGIEARVEAFRQCFLAHHSGAVPFFLEPVTLDLVRDHVALIAAIRLTLERDKRPVALVLDTLNRSLRGSESSDEDMSAYVRAADAIRETFGCVVIIVHHCGIEGTRPRGHTSLTGAADAQLSVKRDAGNSIVVQVEYAKDGPQGDRIVSELEALEVGRDEDGESITSCVITAAEEDGRPHVTNRKLSDRQKLALGALTECALKSGREPPVDFGLPAAVRTVTLDEWRTEMLARGVLDRDGANPRADFKRAKEALAARLLIGERDGLVWIA